MFSLSMLRTQDAEHNPKFLTETKNPKLSQINSIAKYLLDTKIATIHSYH
jgi:hypothetical protein